MKYIFFTIFIFVWIYNLTLHRERTQPKVGFYFWTTKCKIPQNFPYTPYIKILDMGFDGKLKVIKTTCKYPKNFIPVIYIDNKVLKNYPYQRLIKIIKRYTYKYKTIQFDCDWTKSTKKRYFLLLKSFLDKNITATIRLHQIKYFKQTGIPPIKRGILMFYNMSNFLYIKTKNYILDLKIANKYLQNFDYPLPLDIALPIYSQATIMRYGRVVGLIEGVTSKDMTNNFKKIDTNLYKVTKTHYFFGKILYKGDLLRVDEVSQQLLQKSIKLLKKRLKKPINNIIFFRYNPKYFEKLRGWLGRL